MSAHSHLISNSPATWATPLVRDRQSLSAVDDLRGIGLSQECRRKLNLPSSPLLHHLPSLPSIHLTLTHIVGIIILRRIRYLALSERDVDPPLGIFPFRYRVLPIVLSGTPHHHHIPIRQDEFLDWDGQLFIFDVTEEEVARTTKGEGSYTWIGAEERFRVGMVGDRVDPIGVVVDQREIICLPSNLFN